MTVLKVAHQLTGMFHGLLAVGQPVQYVVLNGTSAGACTTGITGRSGSQISIACLNNGIILALSSGGTVSIWFTMASSFGFLYRNESASNKAAFSPSGL